jgi:hypothetical protein
VTVVPIRDGGNRAVLWDGLPAHRNRLSVYTGRVLAGSVPRTTDRGATVVDVDLVPGVTRRLLSRPGA